MNLSLLGLIRSGYLPEAPQIGLQALELRDRKRCTVNAMLDSELGKCEWTVSPSRAKFIEVFYSWHLESCILS